MARKESPVLTEAELPLMDVIWARGTCTVSDVLEALPNDPPLAYNTVLTTLRILEEKGYLEHEKDGRAFVYKPRVPRDQARRSAVDDVGDNREDRDRKNDQRQPLDRFHWISLCLLFRFYLKENKNKSQLKVHSH